MKTILKWSKPIIHLPPTQDSVNQEDMYVKKPWKNVSQFQAIQKAQRTNTDNKLDCSRPITFFLVYK